MQCKSNYLMMSKGTRDTHDSKLHPLSFMTIDLFEAMCLQTGTQGLLPELSKFSLRLMFLITQST